MRAPARNTGDRQQEDAIALKMRAAASGIGNVRIKLIHIKRINLPTGESLGHLNLPVVRVQGTATILNARRMDFAAVGEKNIDSITIDVGKHDILHTACKHADAVRDTALRTLHSLYELRGLPFFLATSIVL